jgi:hypothetical protein
MDIALESWGFHTSQVGLRSDSRVGEHWSLVNSGLPALGFQDHLCGRDVRQMAWRSIKAVWMAEGA